MRRSQPKPLLYLAAIAAVGFVISFSGWRGSYDAFRIDDIGNRDNARALITDGTIPVSSGLSGLGAYNPPGGSWYMIASVFFEDIRLGERFTSFLLYLLTIVPMYLLTAYVADEKTALWVVGLYLSLIHI